MSKILIVEDDMSIHKILEEILKQEKYETLNAYSGTEALMLLEKDNVDLVLLDLMLPGLNGEEIIKKVNNIPIIVLSAKISTDDKVNCLLNGASDYLTKPFDKKELLARIKVQLRTRKEISPNYIFKDLILLKDNYILKVKDKEIALTKTEYAILKQLFLYQNQVVSKSKLLDLIRFDTEDCDENSLRVHISNIRKKIKKYSNDEYIDSVWGVGFKLKNKS